MAGPWINPRKLPLGSLPMRPARKVDYLDCTCGHKNLDHRHFIDPVNGFVSDCLVEDCNCKLFTEKK